MQKILLSYKQHNMKQKIHTGCGCKRCGSGRDKETRNIFHRMMRRLYKKQLQKDGEITDVNKSIGYTD